MPLHHVNKSYLMNLNIVKIVKYAKQIKYVNQIFCYKFGPNVITPLSYFFFYTGFVILTTDIYRCPRTVRPEKKKEFLGKCDNLNERKKVLSQEIIEKRHPKLDQS
jgi:hypothetical protein